MPPIISFTYTRVLAGEEKALGPDHDTTISSVKRLGNLYRKQHKPDETEQMFLRVLASYEKSPGPNHASTLSTIRVLGDLYHGQGRLDEAEQMYARLAGCEQFVGGDDPGIDSSGHLGLAYSEQKSSNILVGR
jgi:tetratricopeptide (TPR) repeat protein